MAPLAQTPLTKLTMALIGAAGMVVTLAGPVAAQVGAPGIPPASSRPVELSIGLGGAASWLTSGGSIRAMITIPVNDRRSIEIFGGPYRPTHGDQFLGDIRAVYGFQSLRRIQRWRRPGFESFFLVGAEGAFVRQQTYGGCYAPGCARQTRVLPLPPVILTYGLGAQKTISPRVALRVDGSFMTALFIPLGLRAGVSLSMPLGQTYKTSTQSVRK